VDTLQPAVCCLRAHERDVLQAGQPDIGDELAVATEETRVFLALQPRPDPAVGFIMGGHYDGVPVPVRIRFVPRACPDASEYLEGVKGCPHQQALAGLIVSAVPPIPGMPLRDRPNYALCQVRT